MSNLLKGAGFELVFTAYIFSILPVPIFLFRTIPSLLGFNRNSNNFNKHKREHSTKKGFLANILDRIWSMELNMIKKRKRLPIGGSCFIIARKTLTDSSLVHWKTGG